MKAVFSAGGRGTRIASVNSEVPKPMINICGKPVLHWGIENLVSQGITDITLTVGYLGQMIKNYFGDGGAFGCDITYITEEEPLGTAGALFYLRNKIKDDFLLLNGDSIFDVDLNRFHRAHIKNNGIATVLTHPNCHPYDSVIVVADRDNKVIKWITKEDKRDWYKNRVNAGIHFLSPGIFGYFGDTPVKLDLDRDILAGLIPEGKLYCYDSPEYVKDMGTPERYAQVEEDISRGLVKERNLSNKQSALFLDRDGTINKYKGFLTDINDFELNDGIADLIKKANSKGVLVIVITNQPVIARGDITWEQLDEIHNKMETLLGRQNAFVDAVYVCPHHPDKGFEGERLKYKIDCDCRKPKPGLLMQAALDFNIDLTNSVMLGDSERDVRAAEAAGCKGLLIDTDKISVPFMNSVLEMVIK